MNNLNLPSASVPTAPPSVHVERLDTGLVSRFFLVPAADPQHAIVQVRGCVFPPTITGNDLVCVDFTCTQLTCDSMYVVAFLDGATPWIAIRRFQSTGKGWLMFEDAPGKPEYLLTHADMMTMQIVGRIKEYYKAGGA